MFVKSIIIIVMLIILFALGSGLFFLVRDEGTTKRTVKALTWRIALSLALFLFLFIAFSFGWIKPHAQSFPLKPGSVQLPLSELERDYLTK